MTVILINKNKCYFTVERSEVVNPDYPKFKRYFSVQCERKPKYLIDNKKVCGIHKNVWIRFNERLGRESEILEL